VGYRRRRPCSPTCLFAGDEHSLGIPTPSTPCLLCEIERPNPNLKLFGYYFIYALLTSNFLQKSSGPPWLQQLAAGGEGGHHEA